MSDPQGAQTAAGVGRRNGASSTTFETKGEPRSYYGKPVVATPVWEPDIAVYFFTGGLAGASASLALAARLAGNDRLARSANLAALAGIVPSPILLIKDLGRPSRFLNMLRVFKVTSPMSVGTWIVSAAGAAIGVATVSEVTGIARPLGRAAEGVAGVLGLPLTTYTAALVADTATPVWSEARRELPFVFAGSAAASAGAAAAAITRSSDAGPARRLAIGGAAVELLATQVMEHRLGALAEPYEEGRAGRYAKAAKGLSAVGTAVMGFAGRRRAGAVGGASLLLAGSMCERLAVFHAGYQSAADPRYTVEPQRRRLAQARAVSLERR